MLESWLEEALALDRVLEKLSEDKQHGGYQSVEPLARAPVADTLDRSTGP